MKHKIKIHIPTPEEQAKLDRMEQEMIGHRVEDYPNYDEYFKNEVIKPIEAFYRKQGLIH